MNITLFGGAFDPPHLGHQQVVSELLTNRHIIEHNQTLADEVWYVPVKNHNFGKAMTSVEHRIAMLKLIQVPNTKIELCEAEAPADKINLTIDTLSQLSAKHPQHTFSWVIGSDNLPNFHKWAGFPDITKKYTFYVYPRQKFPMKPLYPDMIPLIGMKEVVVSSTQIRGLVKNGQSLKDLVDKKVETYINEHSLYT